MILVVGGSGFVGSFLVERLHDLGQKVIVADKNKFKFSFAAEIYSSLEDIPGNCSFEKIYHLASFSDLRTDTLDNLRNDTEITERLLLYMSKHKPSEIIFASSSTVYGECLKATKEDGKINPISFYGVGKITSELLLKIFAERHKIKLKIFRLTNVVGPRMKKGVIFSFLYSAKNLGKIFIRGDGSQERNFVHVSELIEILLSSKVPGGVYNVSTSSSISVEEIADLVFQYLNLKPKITYINKRPNDISVSRLSGSRIQAICGLPSLTSREAVKKAIVELSK